MILSVYLWCTYLSIINNSQSYMAKTTTKNNFREQGNIYYKADKFDQAIDCYQKYISQDKQDPSQNKFAYHNMSLCLFKQQKYEQCLKACDEALKIDSEYLKSYYRKVFAYEKLGNFYQAFINALKCYDLYNSDDTEKLEMQKKINETKKLWLEKKVNGFQTGGQDRFKQRKQIQSEGKKNGGTFWEVRLPFNQNQSQAQQQLQNSLFLQESSLIKFNHTKINAMIEQKRHAEVLNEMFKKMNQMRKENRSSEEIRAIRLAIQEVKQKVKVKQQKDRQQKLASQRSFAKDNKPIKQEPEPEKSQLQNSTSLVQQKAQVDQLLVNTKESQRAKTKIHQNEYKHQQGPQASQTPQMSETQDGSQKIEQYYEQYFHRHLKQTSDDFSNFYKIFMAMLTDDQLKSEVKTALLKILPKKVKNLAIIVTGLSKKQKISIIEVLKQKQLLDCISGIKQYQSIKK